MERYDAKRGRVDVKLMMDPRAPTRFNLPVLWGRHRWPLQKGDVGFLHHTHADSAGAASTRQRRYPETSGNHKRETPWFNPLEPVILSDPLDSRWSATSATSDLTTWGPNDEVFFLEGGGHLIIKSTGAISFLPPAGRGVAIGGGAEISAALKASTTWDPPSLASGALTQTSVTVTGAAVGDVVMASLTSIGTAQVLISAVVSATNTVTVTLRNDTGGVHDLGSGTLKILVFKVI